MGWSGGSDIILKLTNVARKIELTNPEKVYLYKEIVDVLINMDWDTCDEVLGLDTALDAALKEFGYTIEN